MKPRDRKIIYMTAIPVAIILVIVAVIVLTQPKPHPLGFSIYTNQSSLLPQYKIFYSNAGSNSLLIDDEYSTPLRIYLSYYNRPQAFPRIIFANNYSELASDNSSPYVNDVALATRFNFSGNDYMGYDIENWSLTPKAEQDNMAKYTQLACEYVHAAGYKFAFTPEIDLKGWGEFEEVNWTCVNLLDLQEQFLSSNPSSLANNVTHMLAASKAKNPNLTVFVQLDMAGDSRAATFAELETDINKLSRIPGVNGIIIQDLCNSTSCNNELGTLVNYTKSVGIKNATYLKTNLE